MAHVSQRKPSYSNHLRTVLLFLDGKGARHSGVTTLLQVAIGFPLGEAISFNILAAAAISVAAMCYNLVTLLLCCHNL